MIDNRTMLDKQHQVGLRASHASSVFAPLSGESSGVIADMTDAELKIVSVNEIGLDQKMSETEQGQPRHDDPVALRYGAWARPLGRIKYYLAKISLDALHWSGQVNRPHRTEVGFFKLAIDELYDGDGHPLPMITLNLTENDSSSNDADMQPVATFTRNGIRFYVPVFMEGGQSAGPAAPSRVSRFYSDDGRYVYNVQGDPTPEFPLGRIVQYNRNNTDDETLWTPVAILRPEALGQ